MNNPTTATALGIVLLFLVAMESAAFATSSRKIGDARVFVDGCHDKAKTYTTGIPDPTDLERSYQGRLPGIQITQNGSYGKHEIRLFEFANGGSAIRYTLWAEGSGTWIKSPFGGGGVCAGAHSAAQNIQIYAHYK